MEVKTTARLLVAVVWAGAAFGQAPAAKAPAWVQPKTAWGDPDLQGLWPATDMINVPLQRNTSFGTRTVLTEEETAGAA